MTVVFCHDVLLNSTYWLIIHVLTIVSSYAGGALAWGLANIAMVLMAFGNPRKETFTGGSEDYGVAFTYTYDDLKRPLSRAGELTLLTGQNAGAKFSTLSTFTYY